MNDVYPSSLYSVEAGVSEAEIEITPKMIKAATAILYNEPLVFPCGVDFDASDLVARVFLAMERHRPSKLG